VKSDLGYVGRNVGLSKITRALLSALFNPNGEFVDYGGGYGMFVRLMRDAGFRFYRYDRHCENLFAQGFDWEDLPDSSRNRATFELVTAFEVFEHLANPIEEIDSMLKIAPNVLFSTILLPEPPPLPGQWWYFVLEYGQHISFYSRKSLGLIAQKFGLYLYTDGNRFHLLSRRKLSPALFRLIIRHPFPQLINFFWNRPTLLAADFLTITGRPMQKVARFYS
jgi:hypothetical protein